MHAVKRFPAAVMAMAVAVGLGLGIGGAPAATAQQPPTAAWQFPAATQQSPAAASGVNGAGVFQVAAQLPSARKKTVPRNPRSVDVLVNKAHPLVPRTFTPRLVRVPATSFRLQAPAASAYARLVAAARQDGVTVRLTSAYRSHATQQQLLRQYTRLYGAAYAHRIVAMPGTSEHQTGLAVDVGAPGRACALKDCFAKTSTGRWMAANAHRYGFILRYPRGQEKATGYKFEPWHYRYLGVAKARAYVSSRASTLEAYYGVSGKASKDPVGKAPATTTRTATANLNMRSGPGTGYRILATVRKGTKVALTGKRSGTWYAVRHGSRTGWMAGAYLR